MYSLSAQGLEPGQTWQVPLEPGRVYLLGRDAGCALCVPWDPLISRQQADLRVTDEGLHVVRRPEGRNPLFFAGQEVAACDLRGGQHFVIGTTRFRLISLAGDSPSGEETRPVGTMTFSRQSLKEVRFRDADKRFEVLTHLPEVISGARDDSELFLRLANLLLAGVPQAEAVAIVAWDQNQVKLLHWDRRRETAGAPRPSSKLVREAIEERGQSVLHVWEAVHPGQPQYTVTQEFDWAFCTPVIGPATAGWGLYLAGRRAADPAGRKLGGSGVELQPDIKFVELVSEITSSVRHLRQLERRESGLRQFFSPAVLTALGDQLDTAMLAPREAEVTILFCDLRGFSRQAEESREDLLGLLERVSGAMHVMTQKILAHGGGIGDFLGDAAMGFWGWPVASTDAPLDACRAALGIRLAFQEAQERRKSPLANFRMGIGIAHGRAVAGKIGTSDQVKVTVFGPVVNLAARLEGMTKQLRVPIVLDEAVAGIVRRRMPSHEARTRRLARVLPHGMRTPLTVSELVPPLGQGCDFTDEHLARYDSAVDNFILGRWDDAYQMLHGLPASDHAQDFLAVQIAQHNRTAPPDWDGIVRLAAK